MSYSCGMEEQYVQIKYANNEIFDLQISENKQPETVKKNHKRRTVKNWIFTFSISNIF